MAARLMLRALSPLAAGVVALAAGLVPAQAATPGWRIVTTIGSPGLETIMTGVQASGSGDAWAAGEQCTASCSAGPSLIVDHYTGGSWQLAALPSTMVASEVSGIEPAVTSSSATDAWVFAATPAGKPEGLHWDGAQWTATTLPGWAFPAGNGSAGIAAEDFGTAGVWVFSLSRRVSTPAAAFFNGTTWVKRALPADLTAVSALSAANMWAVGVTAKTARLAPAKQVQVALHWNGKTWRTVRMPSPKLSRKRLFFPVDAAALGSRNLWVEGAISKGNTVPTTGLLHWNGTKWTRVTPPLAGSGGPMAQDGHGGFWLPQVGTGVKLSVHFLHYSGGHWTTRPVPTRKGTFTFPGSMAWIPGTKSLWATAGLFPTGAGTTIKSAILKYGP